MNKINLEENPARFFDHWNPRIVAALNGPHVKRVKFRGESVWHRHEQEELFGGHHFSLARPADAGAWR